MMQPIDADVPAWVNAARALPLTFAQVREDAAIDRELVETSGARDILMIASGGCTAAVLAALPQLARLTLVDLNPAQLALARLKLRLIATAEPVERLALLGHAPLDPARRRQLLATLLTELELPTDILGPLDQVSEAGPDQNGRYELVFAELRRELRPVAAALDQVLGMSDPSLQATAVRAGTSLGDGLDRALDAAMAQRPLEILFGARATANRVQPFARHFAAQIRRALATLPAATNPYLWQMLAGCYPRGHVVPWLELPRVTRLPRIDWHLRPMEDALVQLESGAYDVVHLSNILDWLDPAAAAAVLVQAARVLRPGGSVLVRQLNSSLDIRALPAEFLWQTEQAARWLAADRSFFYRDLHVGRRA